MRSTTNANGLVSTDGQRDGWHSQVPRKVAATQRYAHDQTATDVRGLPTDEAGVGPQNRQSGVSPTGLAIFGAVAGVLAFVVGRVTSTSLGRSGELMTVIVFAAVAMGVSIAAGLSVDPVVRRLRQFGERRRG